MFQRKVCGDKTTVWRGMFSFGLAFIMTILMPVTGYAEDWEAYRAVFDAEYYYSEYPDLQETVGNDAEMLFSHFVSCGAREGRSGNEEFNLRSYIFYNRDLLDAYQTNLSAYCRHYLERGRMEGRPCLPQDEGQKMLGTYSTQYDPSMPRATNIHIAAERIHKTVLQPGQLFSFSSAVQSRIPQNGYVMAPAIGGNEYGGGICQVSSTLYAAMCHALLPAAERHPHSSRVSYLPEGLDATISEGYKDLKFVNPFQKPLTILVEDQEGVLTVSLYLGAETQEYADSEEAGQAEEKPAEEESAGVDQTQEEPAGGGQTEEGPAGEGQSEGEPAGEGQAEEDPAGEGQAEEEPVGESQAEEEPAGEGQTQEEPAGEDQAEEEPAGESQTEEEPAGEGQPEEGPAGESRPEEEPVGESQTEEEPAGESQAEEEPAGESQTQEEPTAEGQGSPQLMSGL